MRLWTAAVVRDIVLWSAIVVRVWYAVVLLVLMVVRNVVMWSAAVMKLWSAVASDLMVWYCCLN